jgi:flagellar hook-associated protein 2
MSQIRSSTGLASGLDIGAIVEALINAERAPARRLEARRENLSIQQSGLNALQAGLLALSNTLLNLKDRNTFTSLALTNSDPAQLRVTSKLTSLPGLYQFQSVRLATNHRSISRGFANADSQQIGTSGQLVISRGRPINQPTKLELLNGGQGIRRGQIQLTDRSGATAQVDLRNVVTLEDVVTAINSAGVGVQAKTLGGQLVLTDTTGQSTANLSVSDVGGGFAAVDLGIAQSVAGSTLTGSDVYQVTTDFTLNLLNDGNRIRQTTGADDLRFALADGSSFAVNIDNAVTVGDLLAKINDDADNAGKLTAELSGGRIVLTDHTTGGDSLVVSNLSGSNATQVLGLDAAANGDTLTGKRLIAGANSALLRNLRGGQGITQLGDLSLTDRTGATATIDLSSAESLDEVLAAINAAMAPGDVKLQIVAELNANGDGLVIRDTSGGTASNLVIADANGGTLADELGIAIDAAQTSVSSGPLGLRSVNEATSLANYSPRGGPVSTGSFRILDSAGNQAVINITSAVANIGDVLDRINNASGLNVTARLNDTGDGIVLVDEAGGAGTLTVTEVGGRTAADLRLLGTGVVGTGGQQEIVSRNATIIDVAATDTLTAISTKINSIGGNIRAAVVNSGAAINGFRLSLSSTLSGQGGRFIVNDGGLDLGFTPQELGQDAVLRVGSDPATGFLLTSTGNTFSNVPGNIDVTLLGVGTTAANIAAVRDEEKIRTTIQGFVSAYNAYIDLSTGLTKYDPVTETRASLQGDATPLLVQNRFNTLINKLVGDPGDAVRSLADVGVKLIAGGKLSFDPDRLTSALASDPDAVRDLFSGATDGFARQLDDALTGFHDRFTGTLQVKSDGLQRTIDTLTERIGQIDAQLEVRKTRLELKFVQMETILSGLQSQQQSLNSLSTILSNMRYSRQS